MNVDVERLPRFLRFLVNVAKAVEVEANKWNVEMSYQIKEIEPRSDHGSGLTGVELSFEADGETATAMIFAAGTYRNKSMVKIKMEGEDSHDLVSSSPKVVFATVWFGH